MGFTPQQARIALAATDSGVDVQAALESLLNAGPADGDDDHDGFGSARAARRPDLTEEEEWERREEERERRRRGGGRPSNGQESAPERRARRPSGPSSSSPPNGTSQSDPATLLNAQQLREQADKVLSQASEIGLNVFNRANTFWSQGKAQLQKAYEERKAAAASAGGSGGAEPNGTRPKWAQGEFNDEDEVLPPTGGFRDDDDEGPEDPVARHPHPSSERRAPAPVPRREEISLFDDEPKAYVSPNRRRPGREAPPPSAPPPVASTSSPSSRRPPTAPSSSRPSARPQPPSRPTRPPSPLFRRTLVPASSSALASSKSYRTKGTEMFKLGRFAEAQTFYGQALSQLPSGHIVSVVLLNNRAAASMKTGDHKSAVEDCTSVLSLIEGDRKYNPAKEEPLPPLEDGEVVSLAEGYVKALHRRAQAFESGEKWDKAREDWERLVGVDWPAGARLKQEAINSMGRCRKMLASAQGGHNDSAPPARSSAPIPPKPRPKPANLRPTQQLASLASGGGGDSEGVSRLRAAADSQEAEEVERIRIKDSVDAKLLGWKGGKESNLRALIASLDTVLWPELGWTKIGMSELVTPNQVKIRYMKAIGRVHPDKVSLFLYVWKLHYAVARFPFSCLAACFHHEWDD